jgi:hypothetical protein
MELAYHRRFFSLLQEAVEYSPAIETAIERAANRPTTASRSVILGGSGAVSPPAPGGAE